ncbi:MAG: type II toxin-antitoxin system VapB family antitoxin [Gammaproteobacteria bacterium]|nr:type II toxin-antitoxin system VapB family antitoxin [Gammaproteobacteria bacterium]MCY4199692.1 type II toxin-antitoxin system VapB family antitoxin [Gammaproteobacteria bacterium]MCY4276283.1 type II toxin-antitoxin system VapB family antitoxin [Gammaproteobacteria bacterium]MCY4322482.1 type II toxin-antitoxin system VapB family antitoxin [Gammaproteobacteria bacterium]
MRQSARIFMNGRSQAVRIPKAFAYEGVEELQVRRIGDRLILEPVRKSWLTLNDESSPVGLDFMKDRPDLFAMEADRIGFE